MRASSWLSFAPALALALPAQETVLVKAARLVIAPDAVSADASLLLRGGKVVYVGTEIPADAKSGARVVEFAGMTIVPAFVCAHAHLSAPTDLAERISAVTPELKAGEAFDPFDPMLARMARCGVAVIALAPASTNTLAGLASVVTTGTTGTLIADATYLKVSLTQEALDPGRYPTSLMGACDLVRSRLQATRGARNGQAPIKELHEVLTSGRKLAIHARTHAEITSACELCESFQIQPILIDADEAEKSLARLAALKASIVLAPLTLESTRAQLRLPALLEQQRIPFSFRTAGAERPEQLRLSAALALRSGVSRATALAALTRVPAEQSGVAQRTGTLRAGMSADFVVCDGDPLDLSARIVGVWLAGEQYFKREGS